MHDFVYDIPGFFWKISTFWIWFASVVAGATAVGPTYIVLSYNSTLLFDRTIFKELYCNVPAS